MSRRTRVHALLAPSTQRGSASWWVDRALIAIILTDFVAYVVEVDPDTPLAWHAWLRGLELAIAGVYVVEYFLRLWSSVEDPRYAPARGGRWRWARTPLALLDLAAWLPLLFLLPLTHAAVAAPWALTLLRGFRLLRILRAARIARYSGSLQAFGRAFAHVREELFLLSLIVAMIALVATGLIQYFEGAAQPGTFDTLSDGLWWVVVTMTTVGYGDAVPVTEGGRLLGGLLGITGVAMFAMSAGLLGASFSEEMRRERGRRDRRRDRQLRRAEAHRIEEVVEEVVEEAVAETLGGLGIEAERSGHMRRCDQCGLLRLERGARD